MSPPAPRPTDQIRELVEAGLRRQRPRVVVLAQQPEQPAHLGECLATGLLDVEDRLPCPLGVARNRRRAPPACTTIALTLWAMMSCSSRPIVRRSCSIAARSRSLIARRRPERPAHRTQLPGGYARAPGDRRTRESRTAGMRRTGPRRARQTSSGLSPRGARSHRRGRRRRPPAMRGPGADPATSRDGVGEHDSVRSRTPFEAMRSCCRAAPGSERTIEQKTMHQQASVSEPRSSLAKSTATAAVSNRCESEIP